jgi:hypothetical protein
MNRLRVGLAIFALVSGLATTADAGPFSLAGNWSATNDGLNSWLYGRYTSASAPDPTTFVKFSVYDTTWATGMGFWRTPSQIDPNIEKNLTASPLSPCCGLSFAPGEVAFGPYLGPAVARWTAPANGIYDIAAAFETIQSVNDSPNAYVYWGSTQLFNQTATASGISYAGSVNMLAGQTIDFVVWGVNVNNKTTQVDATITPIPEPASMLLLGTGVIAVVRAVRRKRG